MNTPLIDISIASIYKKNGIRVMLPSRMAKCTPDTYNALMRLSAKLELAGGKLYLSDLFRSYDMQLQAHLDYKNKKKSAYSPPPGGSLHEAGRSFDLDLSALQISLQEFWDFAAEEEVSPIIAQPNSKASEAWHFDCRGSHDVVYRYYSAGKGNNFSRPYAAMAASAILTIGQSVDFFEKRQTEATIQAGLIRLGHEIGNMDGYIGDRTRKALQAAGIAQGTLADTLAAVESLLQHKFPAEFAVAQLLDLEAREDTDVPDHVIA